MVDIKHVVPILIALPIAECVNSAMFHLIEDYLLEDLTQTFIVDVLQK